MNSAVKNILKIFAVGLAATVVRIIGQLSIPVWGADCSAAQCFREKRNDAAGLHCLWGICLLPDCLAVPAHPGPDERQPDFAGAEIWPFLLRCVDLVSLEPLPHVAAMVGSPIRWRIAWPWWLWACCLDGCWGSRASCPPEESTIPCSSDAGRSCLASLPDG